MNKKVFRNLSYGVYVVSTLDEERPVGCTANSVMQITSDPATVAISMNHDNYTNACIAKTGTFAVSILSESSDPGLIGTFGFQSGKTANKFDGVSHSIRDGMPVLNDCCGYIVCRVIDKMETSSHTVFLGEVTDGDVLSPAPAMTYAYYHNVIKGKSPKNAPTYLPEEDTAQAAAPAKWVCSVCGYVYDGEIPFEDLPDDYTCPVCRQPKSKFVRK
ncbi:flavin reductase [uncultured Merdimonas sp.]|uniref:flavin reductase n=1 Tax=uncultured Merdimonas sp. TaxID=2023269 RepID=UPI003207B57E